MINGDVPNHGVMSNIMNFQDFDILSAEWLRYGGYIDVKCDSGHFGPANSLPIAIWSKKIGGCFSSFFLLIGGYKGWWGLCPHTPELST